MNFPAIQTLTARGTFFTVEYGGGDARLAKDVSARRRLQLSAIFNDLKKIEIRASDRIAQFSKSGR